MKRTVTLSKLVNVSGMEFGLFFSCFLFFCIYKPCTDGRLAPNKLAGLGLKVLTPNMWKVQMD